MTRTLLTAIFLTLFSQTAWAEKLNAELLCEGYWNVDFRSVEGEDAFAAMMLLEVLKEQMTAERRQFSQRISIKDSVLDEQISLKVTDTLIEADKRAIPTEILSDLPFVVSSAYLRIDRLTGKITGNIEIEKFKTEDAILTENSKDAEFKKGLAKLIKGLDIDGECKKLDPQKKLF